VTERVLLIDDDVRLCSYVSRYLAAAGMAVEIAHDPLTALALAHRHSFDVILLDAMLGPPGDGADGFALIAELRAATPAPIIFLTARGDEDDRVRGLEGGAEDYVVKPFLPRELVARLRVVVRRGRAPARERWQLGDLAIDLASRTVLRGGAPVALTALELDLLAALARSANRPVRRAELRALAGRGDTAVADRAVDVHVCHLRSKLGLGRGPADLPRLETVRGVGYALITTPPGAPLAPPPARDGSP
jgi:DNA-binding response OmpR family regulator